MGVIGNDAAISGNVKTLFRADVVAVDDAIFPFRDDEARVDALTVGLGSG